jgi:hypothetical protein
MMLTLDLPPDLESQLASEASQAGLPLPEYVVGVLAKPRKRDPTLGTGLELVDHWLREGLIGTRPEVDDSQTRARLLRQQAERRKQP